MKSYDVIIIGGGPGGYVAAIRAAQLGKHILVVENNHLGGICLNWGCIPTKSLLHNAYIYELVQNADKYGIDVGDVKINWTKIIKRSRDVSKRLSKGIEYLFKKNKIEYISARGKLLNSSTISSVGEDGIETKYQGDKIIIATGARAKYFPDMKPDGKRIITYKEAMSQKKQPKSLVIIGAGAIGVEFAHFYHTLNTNVTLIESFPNILPIEDTDISKEFKIKEKQIGKDLLKGISVLREQEQEENKIAPCHVCKAGNLRITYSRKTKRYFVSCNNYPKCTFTQSLPPDALIKNTGKVNEEGLPILVAIKKGKRPWEFPFDVNWKEKQDKEKKD